VSSDASAGAISSAFFSLRSAQYEHQTVVRAWAALGYTLLTSRTGTLPERAAARICSARGCSSSSSGVRVC
jgi:hypothetical protein